MGISYFPHTDADIKQMLDRIGANSVYDLYADVPQSVIYRDEYDLPDAMSEMEVRKFFNDLDSKNTKLKIFVGCGAYDHYTPAVVPAIISRSEFLTAYTPYQAEISQGTLRYIFEFQSIITELTGMDCANASMYDGATAAAESMLMALAATKKKTGFLVSATLPDRVLRVVETYAKYHGIELQVIRAIAGVTDLADLQEKMQSGTIAGALVPSINRYGIIEDLTGFADAVHAQKALLSVYADPSALAYLRTPAEWDADIACGDAQSLGIPLAFGGPYVGFLATKKEFVRKLPGRIVGATTDVEGKRAFVLTLQAREQHIRREKANSNICSNQSLMALFVTVYTALMGKEGLKKVNDLCYGGAHYLYEQLLATGLFEPAFNKPFLKEFAVKTSLPIPDLQKALLDASYFAALEIENGIVTFCVTEKHGKEEIDNMVDIIKSVAK